MFFPFITITHGNFLHAEAFPKKSNSDDHFDPLFSLIAVGGNSETKNKRKEKKEKT
jgi:hypothetical protein